MISTKENARPVSRVIGIVALAWATAPACAAQRTQEVPETIMQKDTYKDGCVPSLPFARGEVFCSLDEYLAHLEKQGAIDLPWWRQVQPGVYEYMTTATNAPRERATRDDLMRRFGFVR